MSWPGRSVPETGGRSGFQSRMTAFRTLGLAADPGFWARLGPWFGEHSTLVLWFTVVSGLLCLGGISLLPLLAARLPQDYLLRLREGRVANESPQHWAVTFLRNLGGGFLVLAGVMLVPLPGPGALVIIVGISLMDFPAKRRVLLHLVDRPSVIRPLNRFRRLFGQPELDRPEPEPAHLAPESAH